MTGRVSCLFMPETELVATAMKKMKLTQRDRTHGVTHFGDVLEQELRAIDKRRKEAFSSARSWQLDGTPGPCSPGATGEPEAVPDSQWEQAHPDTIALAWQYLPGSKGFKLLKYAWQQAGRAVRRQVLLELGRGRLRQQREQKAVPPGSKGSGSPAEEGLHRQAQKEAYLQVWAQLLPLAEESARRIADQGTAQQFDQALAELDEAWQRIKEEHCEIQMLALQVLIRKVHLESIAVSESTALAVGGRLLKKDETQVHEALWRKLSKERQGQLLQKFRYECSPGEQRACLEKAVAAANAARQQRLEQKRQELIQSTWARDMSRWWDEMAVEHDGNVLQKIWKARPDEGLWRNALGRLARLLQDIQLKRQQEQALARNLVGLAFSGGGIRSATLNLGVLQGLADAGLLKHFDYLSTVSGGGYIGAWLAAWIKREGSLQSVEQQLRPARTAQARVEREVIGKNAVVDEEPEPIRHLRAHSRYLTPRAGLFSSDSWTLGFLYLRNFLINSVNFLPLVIVGLLLLRVLVPAYGRDTSDMVSCPLTAATFLLLLVAIFRATIELWRLEINKQSGPETAARRQLGQSGLRAFILWPLTLASVAGCWLFSFDPLVIPPRLRLPQDWGWLGAQVDWLRGCLGLPDWFGLQLAPVTQRALQNHQFPLFQAIPYAVLFAALNGIPSQLVYLFAWLRGQRLLRDVPAAKRQLGDAGSGFTPWSYISSLLAPFVAGGIAGFLFYVVIVGLFWSLREQPYALVVCGPPLALIIFTLGAICEVGFLGAGIEEAEREWWARMCAGIIFAAFLWFVATGLAIYGGKLLTQAGLLAQAAWASGWLGTAFAGALAGYSSRTGKIRGPLVWRAVMAVAPMIFLVGLVSSMSALVNVWLGDSSIPSAPDGRPAAVLVGDRYWLAVVYPAWDRVLLVLGICGSLALLAALTVDVNLFSMHGTYANRLIRCYLAASRAKARWGKRREKAGTATIEGGAPTAYRGSSRFENLLTGFDPKDDLCLQDLRIGRPGVPPETSTYWGPLPLINTALNLVGGAELAWQDRRAESFVLSPLYCGSKSTGFRKLPRHNTVLTLGRAVAISGAAASPNMGYHTSQSLMVLMSIFNVRLGWWLSNPQLSELTKPYDWNVKHPAFGGLLWNEILGRTNETGKYVYLSDGGHFDNLGVYELIRRRCKFIVVCDASADPHYQCQDLAFLIQKVRTDFGIRITIDEKPLQPQGSHRRVSAHCTIGNIHYEDVDDETARHDGLDYEQWDNYDVAYSGTLLYVKPSLTGDEPTDVLNYAGQHHAFPHDTTVDQFFTESQFESYRALGLHIAKHVLAYPAAHVLRRGEADTSTARTLFRTYWQCWRPPPLKYLDTFLEPTKEFLDLQKLLGSDRNLRALSLALYPDLQGKLKRKTPGNAPDCRDGQPTPMDRLVSERHAISQMLQIMENTWLILDLDRNYKHPLYAGWMQLFKSWAKTAVFQENWEVLRKEYNERFVRFFQERLQSEGDRGH